MILESVENGPFIWPTIEENGVTRPRKYFELTPADEIQVDCDVKATNIILQGLPPEVYELVSNHRIAKELWDRIQLLMQGTSLTKQERKCKLYDEFDKFAYKKGETLRDFYLRYLLLLNDINIYNVKLEQFQVNTKFLNTLPPEWSKFVTDVKLVWDLHTTNIDKLHAYLRQHEFHANEVRLMHERNSDPLALVATHQRPIHHNVYSPPSSIPQLEYAPTVNQQQQQPEFPQLDSGLTVLVFKQSDDPIDAINHMMSFLSAVVTSRYPTTNNQLRNSSKPKTYTPGVSGSNSGKQRTVICYNCKGEGHMSKQCTKPKRKRDDSWFKDKVLLLMIWIHMTDCDELNTTKVALMANLSHYSSDALAEVHNPDNVNNNVINQGVQVMPSSEQSNVVNHSENEITSDSNIIPYSQYVTESQQEAIQNSNTSAQQDALILSVIEQLKSQVINCTKINLDNKSVNDTLTAELERYKEQVKVLKEGQNVDLKSKDNIPNKVEVSKELPKVSMVNTSLKKLKHHLASFDVVVKERTTATAITEGSWGCYTTLEKYCISLEVDTQLNQENFQRDNSVSNQSALNSDQYFELNELKAQSQEKDMVI
ncbi:retrovirus-related pol polyprotein from transposon TNT 1-94 [Tanacetum coccineum]|uniref:Retrovirus-related pol polyprotein from transposon TNT 1-94 n=1 Tax=Tanacetum coccineum TaxID=301880 RepID=A0ABQ4XPM0_9ASTR